MYVYMYIYIYVSMASEEEQEGDYKKDKSSDYLIFICLFLRYFRKEKIKNLFFYLW